MKNKGGGGGSSTPAPDEFAGGAQASDVPEDARLASEPPPPDDLGGATPSTPGEKPRFKGNWTCATCGADITSLPFEPRDTSNLKCIDCFKKSKA